MNTDDFKVRKNVEICNLATKKVEESVKKKLQKVRKKLSELQEKLYAHGKYSMLICLQGMDTAGKDSLIREIFKDVNAQGIIVHSFKNPSEIELKHDFLWRHYLALPERGKITVFNRTHYENVLVTRVHPDYILNENIPSVKSVRDLDDDFYHKRMEHINNFEKHISENGIIILKFFLHLSKEEQKKRMVRRINIKEKNWKFSPNDVKERKLWDKYQKCYQDMLIRTSKDYAPWYVVPADHKPTSRLIVGKTIVETLKKYDDIELPKLDDDVLKKLSEFNSQINS